MSALGVRNSIRWMRDVTATALRRTAFTGAAVGATLVAHAMGGGHVAMTVLTPLVVVALCGAVFVGGLALGQRQFAVWGSPRLVATLAGAQLAAHLVIAQAPWMFGLGGHVGPGASLTLAALAWHVGAAIVLVGLLGRGQRLLTRLVDAVRAALARPRRGGVPRPAGIIGVARSPIRSFAHGGRLWSRGPPLAVHPN